MAHSPLKLPLAVGLFLVSVWLTLHAGSFHYAFGQSPERDELFQLINQIQKLRDEKQFSRAIPLAERALSMALRTVPETDPRHVAVLITAGEVYWKSGNVERAEPLLQRAVQIAETSLQRSHPLYFASLVNLALFYREQENGAKSQPLFQKLVALMQNLRGREDRQVAVYTKLLAESYFQQGDYAHARPLYERTAELLEKLGATNEQAYFDGMKQVPLVLPTVD